MHFGAARPCVSIPKMKCSKEAIDICFLVEMTHWQHHLRLLPPSPLFCALQVIQQTFMEQCLSDRTVPGLYVSNFILSLNKTFQIYMHAPVFYLHPAPPPSPFPALLTLSQGPGLMFVILAIRVCCKKIIQHGSILCGTK